MSELSRENARIEVEKSMFIVLLTLADQDADVSLAAQHVLISFKPYLSEPCTELIEKHAGNKRLHTGEFTSEFAARLTQTMEDKLIRNILNACVISLSSHNRYIRGQTSTIIGEVMLIACFLIITQVLL